MREWKIGDRASAKRWNKQISGYLSFIDPVEIIDMSLPKMAMVIDVDNRVGWIALKWLDPWENAKP